MKKCVWIIVCFLLLCSSRAISQEVTAFWNLENYFDPAENHPEKPYWTAKKFYTKADMFAKTVLAMPVIPEAIGICEVENAKCVAALVRQSGILAGAGYSFGYVHFDSPDRRGIDVALLYRRDVYRLIAAEPIRIGDFATRDILHATLLYLPSSDTVDFFVCHFPSQLSGRASSQHRSIVVRELKSALEAVPVDRKIIVLGDFNCDCTDPLLDTFEPQLKNCARALPHPQRGTYKYQGHWETLDNFFTNFPAKMCIFAPQFLLEADKSFSGYKPRRTFIGPRYNGGVSDHLPIILTKICNN